MHRLHRSADVLRARLPATHYLWLEGFFNQLLLVLFWRSSYPLTPLVSFVLYYCLYQKIALPVLNTVYYGVVAITTFKSSRSCTNGYLLKRITKFGNGNTSYKCKGASQSIWVEKQKFRMVVHVGLLSIISYDFDGLELFLPSQLEADEQPLMGASPFFRKPCRKQHTATIGWSYPTMNCRRVAAGRSSTASSRRLNSASAIALSSTAIDYQSDARNFGRGDSRTIGALESDVASIRLRNMGTLTLFPVRY
jgi:hypothetical protein